MGISAPFWKRPLGILVLAVLALLILAGIVAALDGSSTEDAASTAEPSQTTETPQATASPSPSPEPEPEAKGRFGLASCDVQLSFNPDNTLIGSTRLVDTGEVPMDVRVTFAWLLGDGSKVEAKMKSVTVAPGAEKLVFFKHPASQDQTDLFQAHPGYFDSDNCRTVGTITN